MHYVSLSSFDTLSNGERPDDSSVKEHVVVGFVAGALTGIRHPGTPAGVMTGSEGGTVTIKSDKPLVTVMRSGTGDLQPANPLVITDKLLTALYRATSSKVIPPRNIPANRPANPAS